MFIKLQVKHQRLVEQGAVFGFSLLRLHAPFISTNHILTNYG